MNLAHRFPTPLSSFFFPTHPKKDIAVAGEQHRALALHLSFNEARCS